ncbi:MAG: HEPN domain-containing protein [Melioribacteraceae bacterium]|nr:HEPN domain-containing protein [Melioribacteraceae bacterium]
MLKSGRYIYAVFMTHLALEKLLKGFYTKVLSENPPRTHNLILLHERIDIRKKLELTKKQIEVIEFLNEKSVPSRYPDVLHEVLKEFNKKETTKLVKQASEIIECLKNQLKK